MSASEHRGAACFAPQNGATRFMAAEGSSVVSGAPKAAAEAAYFNDADISSMCGATLSVMQSLDVGCARIGTPNQCGTCGADMSSSCARSWRS